MNQEYTEISTICRNANQDAQGDLHVLCDNAFPTCQESGGT